MPSVAVAARELEHAVVQRVEAGERDELELVAHRAELALELGDGRVVEVLLPVERRRAVVGEQLARELARGSPRRTCCACAEIGRRRLAPDEVGVRRVGEAARDRASRRRSCMLEEALGRALARSMNGWSRSSMSLVRSFALSASVRATSTVGTSQHVRGEARGDERADELAGRHEHLAAHVAALLLADASWSSK